MEDNFAYVLMHTSPVLLVSLPALVFAGLVFVVCLAERIPLYLQVRHIFLWLPILAGVAIASVAAWQYTAMALSFWPLVLTATPGEAAGGYLYYSRAAKRGEEGERGVDFRGGLVYFGSMLGLTVFGAYIWGRGMRLSFGSTPIMGFGIVWVVLFILALLVGKATWHYVEGGWKPIYCLFRKPGNLWQTRAAVRLAVSVKAANPSLSEGINQDLLRSRFESLAGLLQAEKKPVTKDALFSLYEQHYEEADNLRAQKEAEERKSAQDREEKVKESQLMQAKRERAARGAVAIALEILEKRLTVPLPVAHDHYRQRLTDIADELQRQGEELTSDRLLERYDQCWNQGGLVEFVRAGGGRR